MSALDDSNLVLANRIFNVVSSNNISAEGLARIIATRAKGGQVTVSKELMMSICESLHSNANLISELFEENQYTMELVKAAMRKNHPNH